MPGRRTLPLRPLALLLAPALTALALSTATAAAVPREPSREPFFPRAGNVGYDALHYGVNLAYSPARGRLSGTTTIAAKATQGLRSFSLDLDGLTVAAVRVNGRTEEFSRGRGKLKVRIRDQPLRRGQVFTVEVAYHGRPRKVIDPDGGIEGWYRTPDGALGVGEPQGTAAWIPCNNIPADKASFRISLNVPAPLVAVANGALVEIRHHGNRLGYRWTEPTPMSTYLAVADIGRGRLERSTLDGHPAWTLVDPKLAARSAKPLGRLGEIIRFESSIYGHYPFEAAGSIVDDAPKLGYALETQSRPIYAYPPDLTTVVHETAHQWFGDSVGLKRWPNIWLNEGFATWTEWYYAERHGGRSAAATFHRLYRVPAANTKFWDPPSGHPGQARNLFATSTYVRGGMALEALREKIGTQPFLRLLKTWALQHLHASGDIEEFIALAEEVSGKHLTRLFHRWLFQKGKP